LYLGEAAQGKIVSVCEGALNQNKKSEEISLNFSLKISLRVKGNVKRNLLTKISLMSQLSLLPLKRGGGTSKKT
jgi:hypothetical protein